MKYYELANLVMLPRAWKTGIVYSILPIDGSGNLTFTRSGTADRIDKDGNTETMAANVPRIDYTGGVTCPSLLMDNTETCTLTSLPSNLTEDFTLYFEATREDDGTSSIAFCEFESTTNGEVRIFAHTLGRLRVKLTDDSSNIDNLYSVNDAFTQGDTLKFAIRCTSTDSKLYIGGSLADTSVGIGTITIDNVFDLTEIRLHEMRFYPIALTETQCEDLTS